MRQSQSIDAGQTSGLSAQFQRRWEAGFAWTSACSAVQLLPGLRGFWPMSAIDGIGGAIDLGGFGRTLGNNGNPTYNVDGLAPYIEFDGTGDFLSRADEGGLDILGTETYVAAGIRGLTMGGWFKFDSLDATTEQLMSKLSAGVSGAYYMYRTGAASVLTFSVNSGAANVTSTVTLDITNWFFCVSRFVPSTTVDIYVSGVKTSSAAGVPAALVNLAHDFRISGDTLGAELFDGRASKYFLCAAALPDSEILALFHKTKALFGVK